ncbi:MAG: transporter substrate-binding domain-containing protein [Legionellaceae bacterium]
MKKQGQQTLLILMLLFFSMFGLSHAENKPLRIAITGFTPPFIMQSAPDQFYGFDISLMAYLCNALERDCEYVVMDFNALIPAIESGEADLAISGITITPERAKLVRFSIPYMISEGQFIGRPNASNRVFNEEDLTNKKIGVIQTGVYERELLNMNIKNMRLVEFKQHDDLLEALNLGIIDIALVNAPTALYWQNNSAGKMKILGKPFNVGFGLGLITNLANDHLMQDINYQLMRYENSPYFKQNFDMYLNNF